MNQDELYQRANETKDFLMRENLDVHTMCERILRNQVVILRYLADEKKKEEIVIYD